VTDVVGLDTASGELPNLFQVLSAHCSSIGC
jgi:hypothetical protein